MLSQDSHVDSSFPVHHPATLRCFGKCGTCARFLAPQATFQINSARKGGIVGVSLLHIRVQRTLDMATVAEPVGFRV